MSLDQKTILLTGGTGSFGNKFTKIALSQYDPEAIRIFSRGEMKQHKMRNKFDNNEKLRFFIGNVRNKERLKRAMDGVDIVIHAAAIKQVPACEYNPIEAIRTNVDGAANVIDAAIDRNVDRVIALSTDKAVHPVNLYGATKLVAEKLFVQGNSYTGEQETAFSCVRYGNVVGSRGSVIPVFQEQKKNGKITITDDRMTRFWITLEQGVRFVLNSLDRMHGGEVFVPKIPSMEITDLADVIAPKAEREIIGIRPGEKINEELLTREVARHAREFEDYFIIEPEHPFWDKKNHSAGEELPEPFEYTSGNNEEWLTKDELRSMIKELE